MKRLTLLILLTTCMAWHCSYAQEQTFTHVIQRGETIELLAERYGVSTTRLAELNPDFDEFFTGMSILIPNVPKTETVAVTSSSSHTKSYKSTKKKRRGGGFFRNFLSNLGNAFASSMQPMYAPMAPAYAPMPMPVVTPEMLYNINANDAKQAFSKTSSAPNFDTPFSFQGPSYVDWSTMPVGSVPIVDMSATYAGGAGYTDTSVTSASTSTFTGTSTGVSTGSSSGRSCHQCYGTKKCRTCNGNRTFLNELTGDRVVCPNCTDGLCSACHGTGIK